MENYINREGLENSIKKLNMYIQDEELYIEEIKGAFLNSSYLYKTKNTKKFTDIANEINKNLNITAINQRNNITVLNKTIIKYMETAREVKEKFENIA